MSQQNPPQGWQPQPNQNDPRQNQPQSGYAQQSPQGMPGQVPQRDHQSYGMQPPQPGQWSQPQRGQQPMRGQNPQQGWPQQPGQASQPGQQNHMPPQGQAPQPGLARNLADGEWHRLHKLTPMVSIIGGIFASFFAVFWVFIGLVGAVADGDMNLGIGTIVLIAALLVVVILGLTIGGTILGYRNRQFRLTPEVFEMRSGVIGKANRQARLDRLQSVNLNRPVFARMMGLTILETSGAGKDADIKLMYLGKDEADQLRAEILRRASGAKKQKTQQSRDAYERSAAHPAGTPISEPGQTGAQAPVAASAPPRRRTLSDYIDAAVEDFSSPELASGSVPEPAVVRVSAGRIAGAGFLSTMLVALILVLVGAIAFIPVSIILSATMSENFFVFLLIGVVAIIGFLVFMAFVGGLAAVGTLVSSMNYTVAGTPDGIRVGRGAISQTNDTVAPGRIHAVQVRQPWLWRPFKWYEVKVDRADLAAVASGDSNEQAANLRRQVILPVGTWEEVERVLALVLPMHMGPETSRILTSAMAKGPQQAFVPTPPRAWWLHPVQWKSLGYRFDRGLVYLRRGRFTRRVALVPGERIQSVTLHSSPLQRAAGVVSLWLNTVGSAVTTRLPSLDAHTSVRVFDQLEGLAVHQAATDTSHRWAEAQARTAIATAHMAAQDAVKRGERIDPYTQRMLDAEAAWKRDQAAMRQPQGFGRDNSGGPRQQPPMPHGSPQQPSTQQRPPVQGPTQPPVPQQPGPVQPSDPQQQRPNQNPDGMPPLPPMEPRQ